MYRNLIRLAVITIAASATVATAAAAAYAADPMPLAVNDLPTVIGNMTAWVTGIIAAVATLPQVQAITGKSLTVVNVGFVLAIITAGITVMTHQTVQIRYSVSELLPRLVVGWIAANFSVPICSQLTALANALTGALTGEDI